MSMMNFQMDRITTQASFLPLTHPPTHLPTQAIVLLMSMMNFQMDRITTQARWAALRAVLILKDHPEAFEALVEALQAGR